jgi:hypothetical protein
VVDGARVPWEDPRPDPGAARDAVIAAANARLSEIGAGSPSRPRLAAVPEPTVEAADRVAALERELAASESARAVLIERLQRAERSLAETQLRALEVERKASAPDESHRRPPREEDSEHRPWPAVHPRPELDPGQPAEPVASDEPFPILTSLRERIFELRSALDEEETASFVDDPDAAPDPPAAAAAPEDADAFRERLSRAAGARHRVATE